MAAAYRPLEVTLISAKDLQDVNLFSKMDVYAVAWLSVDTRSKQRIPTARNGGKNPTWIAALLRFSVPEGGDRSRLVLHVLLRSESALGDRDIGEVHVPIKELESTAGGGGDGKSAQFVSYQVRKPSGKAKGVLNFSFKFGEPVAASHPMGGPASYPAPAAAAPYPGPAAAAAPYPPPGKASKADEPVTAYPVGPSTAYPPSGVAAPYPPAGYPAYPPPPPPGYGYGAPPPPGYGYPPPPGYGYGAPPVVQAQQPPRKNKFGMGMGAGLLGGALGGLLIGDMISDAGAYDAGYDAGFDDGGGFDF